MATSLYFKDTDGTFKKIETGGGGGSSVTDISVTTLTSVDRADVIAAGTAFSVPTYALGSDELQIFINGLLCVKGREYTEDTTTTVKFTEAIATDIEISAVVTKSVEGGLLNESAVSENRSAVIASGTVYEVPEHTVGLGRLKVYLDGLLCQLGVHYHDLTETTISFTSDIPAEMQIAVIVTEVN